MFHLSAYFVSLSTVANTDAPALNDDVLTRINSHFMLSQQMDLILAAAMSATLNRARLNSPTLRVISPQFILPIEAAVKPATRPSLATWLDNPFTLQPNEEISMEATSDIAMGNENFTGLVWLTSGLEPIPPGDVYNTRFTSVTAAVANTWTSLVITFDQGLPPGLWAMVGSELVSTNAQAHRWIFPGQIWRPGGLSKPAVGSQTHQIFYDRRLGIWGRFTNTTLPTLQVLVNGTDNAHTGWMSLVKIG